MKTVLRCLYAFTIVMLLVGCSVLPRQSLPPVLHDFGPPSLADVMPVPAVLITGDTITSAPWLADTSIRYRLLYDDPTRLHAYADNRWIASPAELMQMRLQLALGNVDANAAPSSGVAHYRLQVELLDFEQLFDTPQSSRVSARAEAALLNISSGAMLAKHRFAVTLTTSPDVQGAVQGSARATDQLLRQIVQWTAEQLSGVSQGPTHLPNAPKP